MRIFGGAIFRGAFSMEVFFRTPIYVNGSLTLGSFVKRYVKQKKNRPIHVKSSKKISGVNWDSGKDKFVSTFDEIVSFSSMLTVTKRNVLKITNMLFDPLGFLCPNVLYVQMSLSLTRYVF